MLERLEYVTEIQAHIIRAMALKLAELGEAESFRDDIEKANEEYRKVTEAEE